MVTGNIWALYKKATQQGAMQVATVTARNGSTYTVQMQGGNVIDVQSDAAYDLQSKVFIRGRDIVKQAPDLPSIEVEV